MTVLVATASKQGATADTGDRIAQVLAEGGLEVRRVSVEEVTSLDGVTAVVLGSGVYAGSWMGAAAKFVERFQSELNGMPVWAFSCGPVGTPLKPAERPKGADEMAAKSGSEENRVFPGLMDRSKLNMLERGVAKALRVPDGDYRDLGEIDEWAGQIVASL